MGIIITRLRSCLAGFGVVAGIPLAALLAACGGSSTPSATPTSAVVENHAANALTRSAAGAAAATSFSATFHADVVVDGKTIAEDGTMAFRAPSSMYMKMTVADQVVELLVALPDEYLNIPGKGWYSVGEYVVSADAYAKYAKNRGPVDYAGIVGGLKDSRQLDDDEIDGKRYLHYAGTFDPNDAMDQLPQDLLKPGVAGVIDKLGLKPATMEAWIAPDTNLPRRATIDMTMMIGGSSASTKMVLDYASWNEPVDMPDVPKDAKPYSDLTGGLTPADLSYMLECSNWLQAVAKHMTALADLPEDDLTAAERTQVQTLLDDFDNDIAMLRALKPTARFQPSYDKFAASMQDFGVMFDEIEKEMQHEGSGDIDKLTSVAEEGSALFEEAANLFQAESAGQNSP